MGTRPWVLGVLGALALVASGDPARADRQVVAPGIGSQTSVVIDTGANGICETTAQRDDIQTLPVGQGTPFTLAVECGPDRVVTTVAGGDDSQLRAPGEGCPGPNADVIDAGANGVVESPALGDDEQVLAVGTSAPNETCLQTGANGQADTADPVGGDDVRILAVGGREANAPVIRCGANEVSETFANNAGKGGDDVQLVAVGEGCGGAQTPVVDAGANGISETRAQGAELVIAVAKPVRLNIGKRKNTVSRRVKVAVMNLEFGSSAARTFSLDVDAGSCPDASITEVDADAKAGGVQSTATLAPRKRVKGSVVVTLGVQNVTSVASNIPFRCQLTITAVASDTAPAPDDAINTANNAAHVEIEAFDRNDL